MLLFLLDCWFSGLKWNIVCIFCSIPAPCLKAFAPSGCDCSNTRYPGCRFACPGLWAPLGFQPALAKSETWVTLQVCTHKYKKNTTYPLHFSLFFSIVFLRVQAEKSRTSSTTLVRDFSWLHHFFAPLYSAYWKSTSYVIKLGDAGWRKQRSEPCFALLRAVRPCTAYHEYIST